MPSSLLLRALLSLPLLLCLPLPSLLLRLLLSGLLGALLSLPLLLRLPLPSLLLRLLLGGLLGALLSLPLLLRLPLPSLLLRLLLSGLLTLAPLLRLPLLGLLLLRALLGRLSPLCRQLALPDSRRLPARLFAPPVARRLGFGTLARLLLRALLRLLLPLHALLGRLLLCALLCLLLLLRTLLRLLLLRPLSLFLSSALLGRLPRLCFLSRPSGGLFMAFCESRRRSNSQRTKKNRGEPGDLDVHDPSPGRAFPAIGLCLGTARNAYSQHGSTQRATSVAASRRGRN